MLVKKEDFKKLEGTKLLAPDLSLYHPLCSALNISLVEVLNGKDIASDSTEERTNKFILHLLFSKKQVLQLKFLMSLIFGIGIGLLSYSFSDSLTFIQKLAFATCGVILIATITIIRIKIIDKIP